MNNTQKALQLINDAEQMLMSQEDTSLNMALRLVGTARDSLALHTDPQAYKHGRDMLMTAEHYFKMREASLLACNTLAMERLRIEWAIGRMLLEDDEIHRGGIPGAEGRPTLESKYGINRWQAQRYKKIGSIHEQDLETIFQDIVDNKGEVSGARVSGLITQYFDAEDDRTYVHWSIFVGDAIQKLELAINSAKETKIRQRIILAHLSLKELYDTEAK